MMNSYHISLNLILLFFFAFSCKSPDDAETTPQSENWGDTGKQTVLWGATNDGTGTDKGYIFKINGDGSGFEKVFEFTEESGYNVENALVMASNGKLYGTTARDGGKYGRGTWFSLDPVTKQFTKIADFQRDVGIDFVHGNSPLIEFNGKLYHQTYLGDIYSLDLSSNAITQEFDLSKWSQSGAPDSWVFGGGTWQPGWALDQKGVFWGITDVGIFKYQPAINRIDAVHKFESATGTLPSGKLLLASDGLLYGMTGAGGKYGFGVIYSIDPATEEYQVLYHSKTAFGGNDLTGNSPAHFIQLSENDLFSGMTATKESRGQFFTFNIKTKDVNVLFDLNTTENAPERFADDENTGILASDKMIYGFCSGRAPKSESVSSTNLMYQFDPVKKRIRAIHLFENIKSGAGWPIEKK